MKLNDLLETLKQAGYNDEQIKGVLEGIYAELKDFLNVNEQEKLDEDNAKEEKKTKIYGL